MKKKLFNWLCRDEIQALLEASVDPKLYLLRQELSGAVQDLSARLEHVQSLLIETVTRNVVQLRKEIGQIQATLDR